MLVGQEFEERGDEYTLLNHINTDEEAKMNWQTVQEAGKGYIYNDKQKLVGREIARIPADEAAMLETMCDLDYLSFTRCQDRAALRRLLARFPHWRCCEGGI